MHLYIHVPFCARRCSYCDFAIAVRHVVPVDAFVAAVQREWRGAVPAVTTDGATLDTIYFGGGTPSRIGGKAVAELSTAFGDAMPLADDVEITVEANPDDITPELAAGWRAAGVNRISLGVQSHQPSVLEWMHRTHRAEQVAPAMAMLRAAGIDNISVDLIFALPTALERDWRDDLERTLALAPEHISLYGLTVEPRTPLARWVDRAEVRPAGDERYAGEYLLADALLTAAGFEHYEVSNFGKPGRHSRHNAGYWSGVEYLGLGPSAHSFVAGIRSWNIREWAGYLEASDRGASVQAGAEGLSHEQRHLEALYLGLRTTSGLSADLIPAEMAAEWRRAGWAADRNGRLQLTTEGWLRLDALVSRVAAS
mgnify:CR=1 FL=1